MSQKLGIAAVVGGVAAGVLGLPTAAQADPLFQVASVGTTANVNNYPMTEIPGNVRDAAPGTKYLNFAKLNTGIIESFGSPAVVNGITFATANDAAGRDPLTFSIYGSNSTSVTGLEAAGTAIDLVSFTPIALNVPIAGFATDPGRVTTVPNQALANTSSYSTYAIIFPTVRTAASVNSMQIGDITFTNGGTALGGQGGAGPTNPVVGGLFFVPEPASASLLLGVGAAGLLARRRRAR